MDDLGLLSMQILCLDWKKLVKRNPRGTKRFVFKSFSFLGLFTLAYAVSWRWRDVFRTFESNGSLKRMINGKASHFLGMQNR